MTIDWTEFDKQHADWLKTSEREIRIRQATETLRELSPWYLFMENLTLGVIVLSIVLPLLYVALTYGAPLGADLIQWWWSR
jgi:hypothetical protein